jgi:hypothetical protein
MIAEQAGERARETPEPGIEKEEREHSVEPAAMSKAADEKETREEDKEHPLTQTSPAEESVEERAAKRQEDA